MDPTNQYVLGLIVLGLPALSGSIFLLTKAVGNLVRIRAGKSGAGIDPARIDAQDRRIAELEEEIGSVRGEMERLHAVEGFYKSLRAPDPDTPHTPREP